MIGSELIFALRDSWNDFHMKHLICKQGNLYDKDGVDLYFHGLKVTKRV